LAWKKCLASFDQGITASQIPCALSIISPGRNLAYIEAKEVFELSLILKYGKAAG